MYRPFLPKFAFPILAGLCLGAAAVGAWEAPENVLAELTRVSSRDALLAELGGLEGDALKEQASLIARFLPGGDLATWVSMEQQAAMMAVWTKAAPQDGAMAYRLWRIHQLTPDEALKKAALESLQGLPAEVLPAAVAMASSAAKISPEKMARGKAIYMRPGICFTCHQPTGEGIPLAFPPLAGSEWLDGDTDRQIKIVLKGMMGEITVKGESFNGVMTPLEALLNDDEVADVLTYVRNEWGNSGPEVSADQVKAIRESVKGQALPYQAADLLKEHPLRP